MSLADSMAAPQDSAAQFSAPLTLRLDPDAQYIQEDDDFSLEATTKRTTNPDLDAFEREILTPAELAT